MPNHFPVPPSSKRNHGTRSASQVQDQVAAFRACYARFDACLQYQSLRTNSPVNKTINSYLLDFDFAAKRALGNDDRRYRLFQLYFLDGRTAQYCCQQLEMERFTLAQELAQIESLAGHAFTERGLFPVAAYFGEAERSNEQIAA